MKNGRSNNLLGDENTILRNFPPPVIALISTSGRVVRFPKHFTCYTNCFSFAESFRCCKFKTNVRKNHLALFLFDAFQFGLRFFISSLLEYLKLLAMQSLFYKLIIIVIR